MIPTINQAALTSGTLGSAAGRVLFTNSAQNIKVVSIFFTLTTTATVGNRTFVLVGKDGSGNVLWRDPESFAVPAASSFGYCAQVGTPNAGLVNVIVFNLGNPTYLPISGTITILDQTNIDSADAVSAGGQIIYEF